MWTNTESLTGRVDQVLANTVQLVLDGNNFLSAFGHVFDTPTSATSERGGGEWLTHAQLSIVHNNNNMNVHPIDNNTWFPTHTLS